jgi:hypothetical protein
MRLQAVPMRLRELLHRLQLYAFSPLVSSYSFMKACHRHSSHVSDGGGIRGISALVILDEIMHRLQRAENLPSAPLPADYFDLICGTSTGG